MDRTKLPANDGRGAEPALMTNAELLSLSHQIHHRVVNGGTQGPYLDELNLELLRRLSLAGPKSLRLALADLTATLARAEDKWGGPAHDDEKPPERWIQHIMDYAGWARVMMGMQNWPKARTRLLQVAGLAIHAVEAGDRGTGYREAVEAPPPEPPAQHYARLSPRWANYNLCARGGEPFLTESLKTGIWFHKDAVYNPERDGYSCPVCNTMFNDGGPAL